MVTRVSNRTSCACLWSPALCWYPWKYSLSCFLRILLISTAVDCGWWHSQNLLLAWMECDGLAPCWRQLVLQVCPWYPRSLLHPAYGLDPPFCHLCSVITIEALRVSLKALSCEMLSNTKGIEIPGLLPYHLAAKNDSRITSPTPSLPKYDLKSFLSQL